MSSIAFRPETTYAKYMSKGRGFTVVELVVVMVIMAILMGLGFTVVSSSQRNSRDTERQADVESIARGLETRYKQGAANPTGATKFPAGSYPDTYEMRYIIGQTISMYSPTQVPAGFGPTALPGTTVVQYSPPGLSGDYVGFNVATTNTQPSGMTKDTYFYQPLTVSGAICNTGPCVSYKLYWVRETNGVIETFESRRK